MNETLVQALAAALAPEIERQKSMQYGVNGGGIAFKHDLPSGISTTPGNVYTHGPGGQLTWPGVDPMVFNAAMGADSLLNMLPTTPSLDTNPTFAVLTGINTETGDNMDGVCDNAPEAGLMKNCLQTSVFGRYELATPVIDVGRVGARLDRSDPMDLRLVGSPIGMGGPFGISGDTPADIFRNEVSRKFWERNVAFHRKLARQIWSGNPANNSAGGGYREMTGIQTLVNTGHKDAVTGQACPALDSYVVDAAYTRIDTGGTFLIARLSDMMYQLQDRARRSGVTPVRWILAMRSQMFYELSAIWPCNYMTYRCATVTDIGPLAADAIRMRDEMRAGKYLLMDGVRYDVVFDDGIPEADGNETGSVPRGCFASDIYIIPMSVVGGTAVTYMEYFQFNNPGVQDALGNMVLGRIEGAFLTWPRQTNMCVQWQSRIEPRLIMRTPWLAGRLTNVSYCPIQHTRDPFPVDEEGTTSPYFVNGGVTTRSGPSYLTLW